MSQFTNPAVLELLDNYRWRLVEPFEYYTDLFCFEILECSLEEFWARPVNEPTYVVRVPINYITDLTSVPRLLWSIFPPNGKYAKAAIVHDYLYSNAIGNKAWADSVFREAMGVLGVPKWRRWAMYWAVRIFGRGNYERIENEQ